MTLAKIPARYVVVGLSLVFTAGGSFYAQQARGRQLDALEVRVDLNGEAKVGMQKDIQYIKEDVREGRADIREVRQEQQVTQHTVNTILAELRSMNGH